MIFRPLIVLAIVLLVFAASAEAPSVRAGIACEATAVTEWPASAGGNGHFYQGACPIGALDWDDANAGATALGGHLVTLTSQAENDFVYGLIEERGFWDQDGDWCPGPLIGLWEPGDDAEPDGGWEWITGEPFSYDNWAPGEPNNSGGNDENRAAFGHSGCDAGDVPSDEWHDIGEEDEHSSYVIEWDGAPPACQNTPVTQWSAAEGGNDHHYQGICGDDRISWLDANAIAESLGGHLVTNTSAEENEFVFGLIDSPEFWTLTSYNCIVGPWIGAYQPGGSPEPDGGWAWITGEPFVFTNWSDGEPDNFDDDNRAAFWDGCPGPGRTSEWVDLADGGLGEVTSYVIEWEVAPPLQGDIDCDDDVDLDDFDLLLRYAAGLIGGQQSASCPDIGEPVDGDLWGDVNCDGIVDAADALYILASVAGVPLPAPGDCTPIGQRLGL